MQPTLDRTVQTWGDEYWRGPCPAFQSAEVLFGHLPPPAPPLSLHPQASVRIQGVSPPLAAPLAWLAPRLRGPDRFLHIVVEIGAGSAAAAGASSPGRGAA